MNYCSRFRATRVWSCAVCLQMEFRLGNIGWYVYKRWLQCRSQDHVDRKWDRLSAVFSLMWDLIVCGTLRVAVVLCMTQVCIFFWCDMFVYMCVCCVGLLYVISSVVIDVGGLLVELESIHNLIMLNIQHFILCMVTSNMQRLQVCLSVGCNTNSSLLNSNYLSSLNQCVWIGVVNLLKFFLC